MTRKIASFTPEQASAIWKTHKRLLSSRILDTLNKAPVADDPGVHKVEVFNDSGEFIPAYGCMQIKGTIALGNATYVEVVKPDKTDGAYLFNGDRAIGIKGTGSAFAWGVVRMLGNEDEPTIEPGEEFTPVSGQWYIEQGGGPFIIHGPDRIEKKILRGRFASGGGSSGAVIEFEIIDQSSSSASSSSSETASSGEDLCANQVYDAPSRVMARVTGRPCGTSRVQGEDDEGNVEVVDRLESFLFERNIDDIVGKKGLAVLLSGGVGEGSGSASSSSGSRDDCEWVIIWIDWFRWMRVQVDTIITDTSIIRKFKNIKVWDECRLPDDVYVGDQCQAPPESESA